MADPSDCEPLGYAAAAWRRACNTGVLTGLGRRLQALGLSERAVTQCFGVRCPGHAPRAFRARLGRIAASAAKSWPPVFETVPPAAVLPYLFVAGLRLPAECVARRVGDDWPLLRELALVSLSADRILAQATVAILPVGRALVVSDRADRERGRDTALICDDSAFHTIGAVPGRLAGPGRDRAGTRWLDVGTGSGIVPLARPGLAGSVLGTDINPRAVAMARLGAGLSGISDVTFRVADLWPGTRSDRVPGDGPWDLITFNAPIPDHAILAGGEDEPLYRVGPADLLPRFWAGVGALLAPRGEVIVHSWQPESGYPACLNLPGSVSAIRYTPRGVGPAFGLTLWRPDGPDQCRSMAVTLTENASHVTRALLDP
ncbi:MAG: 50S ribosomal protein L11 methyltransferase [Proteobacteria bacterium]|nr:50S ribosomal protein L11 methyltransferase [Pseudomonadota bacterium]